ncbi:MAG: glycosyl hydrolase [Clostridia bacterium]|nr:glycosyl hydrolase [Clostridia bacterium]
MNNIKICGVDLGSLKLYCEDEFDLVQYADEIKEKLGITLETETSGNKTDGVRYIEIDNTSMDYAPYSVTFSQDGILIKGSYSSVHKAARELLTKLSEKSELTASDDFCGSLPTKKVYTKEKLMQVLTDVYNDPDKCIIGEESIPFINNARKRFKDATGKDLAMVGIDLTPYGLDIANKSKAKVSRELCEAVELAYDGGIVNISTHFTNPSGKIPPGDWQHCRGHLGDYDSVAEYEQAFTDLVTKGTEYNTNFQKELTILGNFMKALHDNGIPALFRPLHEMNGYWFWWHVGQGKHYIDKKYYLALWKYIYHYVVDELGIDTMLWVYAPDMQSAVANSGPGYYEKQFSMPTTYCYPGDEYCDIVGIDWYTNSIDALEITHNNSYVDVVNFSNKIGAICECGPRGAINRINLKQSTGKDVPQVELYSSMDFYNKLIRLKDMGYSFCYLLTWLNQWSIPNWGKGDEFMNTDYALDLKAVSKLLYEA